MCRLKCSNHLIKSNENSTILLGVNKQIGLPLTLYLQNNIATLNNMKTIRFEILLKVFSSFPLSISCKQSSDYKFNMMFQAKALRHSYHSSFPNFCVSLPYQHSIPVSFETKTFITLVPKFNLHTLKGN